MQSCHWYVNTLVFVPRLTKHIRFWEYVTYWYLYHCCINNSKFSLPLIVFFHLFKTGELKSGLQMLAKYMQPFCNHRLLLSSWPREESTVWHQCLARLACHFSGELPSCQSRGTWWKFTCGWKCRSWSRGGWGFDSGSWYAIKDNGRWDWVGRVLATVCWKDV